MNFKVFHQVTFVTKCPGAMDTFEWFFSCVFPNMPLQLSSSAAFIVAYVALVWLLLSMVPPYVHLQLTRLSAGEVAKRAMVRFFMSMHHLVLLQSECQSARVAALVTFIRFFSTVCPNVLSQTINDGR